MAVDLNSLVLLPALATDCGRGCGLAACPILDLLVTSCHRDNTLHVFALPGSGTIADAGAGLARVCTLGGVESPVPMQFRFVDASGKWSGWMAFTGPPASRHLILTDAGHDAVHVMDVVGRVHVGYVAAPGTIAGPRGVAARGSLVAVSSWTDNDHLVRLFEGTGASWSAVRVLAGGFGGPGALDGELLRPYGVRFTADGSGLAVADSGNGRLSLFHVADGSFVRHVAATGLSTPMDVEECEDGWLVVCFGPHDVKHVHGGGGGCGGRLGGYGTRPGQFNTPTSLAVVPGLGLVVRELLEQRLQVFATPSAVAMAAMSPHRVAWMVAVARGLAHASSTRV